MSRYRDRDEARARGVGSAFAQNPRARAIPRERERERDRSLAKPAINILNLYINFNYRSDIYPDAYHAAGIPTRRRGKSHSMGPVVHLCT